MRASSPDPDVTPGRKSRLGAIYARLSPRLAHRPGTTLFSRAHARLIGGSRGRIGSRFFGGAPLLVLRSVGRRSGEPRESPMLYVMDGDTAVVCASNAASARMPAWWLNLQANADAEVLIDGRWRPVRARAASESEAAALWPRLQATYAGFDHYRSVASRELPVVLLEPR